jgi:hypothetical protein
MFFQKCTRVNTIASRACFSNSKSSLLETAVHTIENRRLHVRFIMIQESGIAKGIAFRRFIVEVFNSINHELVYNTQYISNKDLSPDRFDDTHIF